MTTPKPKRKRSPRPAVELRRLLAELGRVTQDLRIMLILLRAAISSFQGSIAPIKSRKEARAEAEQLSLFVDALHDVVSEDVQPGCDTAPPATAGVWPK